MIVALNFFVNFSLRENILVAIYTYLSSTIYLLLYKAEKPSVCLSVRLPVRRTSNSVVSACIDVGLALHDSDVLWHVQVCFKKFLSTIVCPLER